MIPTMTRYSLVEPQQWEQYQGIHVAEPTEQTTLELLPIITPPNTGATTLGTSELPMSLGYIPGQAFSIFAEAGGPLDASMTGLTNTILERNIDRPY